MKKKLLKSFLLAVTLLVGTSAWAYTVPTGYEIKKVLIGTESAGVVSAEDFSTVTISELETAGWSKGTCSSLAIYDISTNSDITTNYASGNTLRGVSTRGESSAFTFAFDAISSGKLVLNCDLVRSGSDKNDNIDLYFQDEDGNDVIYFGFKTGDNPNYFNFSISGGTSSTAYINTIKSNLRGYLTGYRISDMVIDFETGDVTLNVTYMNTASPSVETTSAVSFNMGLGQSIAKFTVSMRSRNKVSQAYNIDNISLYTVDYADDAPVFSVVARCEETDLKTIASQITENGQSFTAYLPRIVEKDGSFYEWSDYTDNTSDFSVTYTMGASAETKYVDYILKSDIVAYSEIGTGTTASRSGGGSSETSSKLAQKALSEGIYRADIKIVGKGGSGSNYRQQGVYVGGDLVASTTENSSALKSLYFSVPNNGTDVYVRGKGSSNHSDNLDYVIIRKVEDITNAIADCKTYEKSNEFSTYIYGLVSEGSLGTLTTKERVYAAHTSWQISQADDASSNDITKVILDAAVTDNTHWNDARTQEENYYTGAPDHVYFDAWQDALTAKQTIYGLPAGAYTIKVATRASAAIEDIDKLNVYAWDGTNTTKVMGNHIGTSGGNLGGNKGWSWSILIFTLSAESNVEIGFYANPGKGLWASCDDWHLYKGQNESATLGTNGFTTFASPYPLDLANLPTGLTAYKAAVDAVNNKVLFTPVKEAVQANTGLLLKGNASTEYDIPVVASGSDISASNKLLVNTGGNTFTAESGYTYYGMIKDSNPLTFGTFDPSTVAIPANKAYLKVSTTTGSRLIASFDDDATAVFDLNDKSEMTNDKWYDLQGRRIDGSRLNPGIYIVNGRKVVVK